MDRDGFVGCMMDPIGSVRVRARGCVGKGEGVGVWVNEVRTYVRNFVSTSPSIL